MEAARRSPRRGWATAPVSPAPIIAHTRLGESEGQQQRTRRWGSNLSSQRHERAIWATCLQTLQRLRRGGSWRPSHTAARMHGDAAGTVSVEVDVDEQGGSASRNGVADFKEYATVATSTAAPGEGGGTEVELETDLVVQLDTLATLTYPNSSIRCVYWLYLRPAVHVLSSDD